MSQLCSICTHPKANEIDRQIIAGQIANTRIAAKYSVKEQAVRAHRKAHLADRFTRANKGKRSSVTPADSGPESRP